MMTPGSGGSDNDKRRCSTLRVSNFKEAEFQTCYHCLDEMVSGRWLFSISPRLSLKVTQSECLESLQYLRGVGLTLALLNGQSLLCFDKTCRFVLPRHFPHLPPDKYWWSSYTKHLLSLASRRSFYRVIELRSPTALSPNSRGWHLPSSPTDLNSFKCMILIGSVL